MSNLFIICTLQLHLMILLTPEMSINLELKFPVFEPRHPVIPSESNATIDSSDTDTCCHATPSLEDVQVDGSISTTSMDKVCEPHHCVMSNTCSNCARINI